MACERLAEARMRRLVDALDRFVGLRDRVDQVLALRRQERVTRFELVELLDGHHVDRAELVDLAAQLGDRFFGGHADAARLTCRDRLRGSASSRRRIGALLIDLHRRRAPPRRESRRTSGSISPAASIRSTSARTSSSGSGDGVEALLGEVARGRLPRWRA